MFVVILLPLGAASGDTGFLQALRNTDYHHVESATVGRGFHTFVMLPDSYAGQEERSYPTIYVLDGGALFPLLASYYRYLSQGDEIEEAIIVGISYGSADYRNGNHRSTDFTAPSAEREYWGGAVKFQQFLETELLPFVESKYRSRTDRRVLFGHSLGGQFVLYSAQTNPGLFWGRIASNPALHRNLEFFLETVPDSQSDAREQRLISEPTPHALSVGFVVSTEFAQRLGLFVWAEHSVDYDEECRCREVVGQTTDAHRDAQQYQYHSQVHWVASQAKNVTGYQRC